MQITDAMVDAAADKLAALDDPFSWLSNKDQNELMRAALSAALSIEQTEPVAWMYQFKTKAPVLMVEKRNWAETHSEWTETPLYAHPTTTRIADSAEAGGSATSSSGTGGGE